MRVGEWTIHAHPRFLDQLEALVEAAETARRKFPETYASRREAKLLAAVRKVAFEAIPADPADKRFEQGETLGAARKHWRRAKFLQQYRLFFRFSTAARIIVLAWVNDEDTKRAYDSRTDAYAVFAKMLKQGDPPDDWDALIKAATTETAKDRLAIANPQA